MDILFISRRSNHSKYFKRLSDAITLNSQVYEMGKIRLSSLLLYFQLPTPNLSDVIQKQLARKKASHPTLFQSSLVRYAYIKFLHLIEVFRWAHYINIYKQNAPRKVALWNGQKLPNATPMLAAKYLNIPVVYFENGLLPNTVTVDHKGVNAHNSLPRTPNFYQTLSDDLIIGPLTMKLSTRPPHKHKKITEIIKLPDSYIFIPLQVPNDTQIVSNSPWITSMAEFIQQVEIAASSLSTSIKLVIKEHPSWPQPFKLNHEKNKRIIFANSNNTQQLIENAQAIITINSTVGIESLLLNKKVITLGSACYNIDGLVLHASNNAELKACIERVFQWQPDNQLRINFLHFLKQVYCIPTRWSLADDVHFKQVEQRILANDKFSTYVSHSIATET